MQYLIRYGLLFLAALSLPIFFFWPQLTPYAPRFHVLCIILSPFLGRMYIRQEDLRGWALSNLALLTHAALLIARGIAGY